MIRISNLTATLCSFLFPIGVAHSRADEVALPAGIDHTVWDALLGEYVNEWGLVDYGKWKANPVDLGELNDYISQYSPQPTVPADGAEKVASLINVYNALTIQWILTNYPVASIRKLVDSWSERRHRVGGRDISLDQIEHDFLRPMIGWKVHAVVVCAARSCPPLRRSAYRAATLEEEIIDAYSSWLSRLDLNRFNPQEKKIEISAIFKWYKEDFVDGGNLKNILATYAPERHREFLESGDYLLEYMDYDWGLNDQSELGSRYKGRLFDRLLDP